MNEISIGKEEFKLSLFTEDMFIHVKNPKEFPKRLLEIISEFSKITVY